MVSLSSHEVEHTERRATTSSFDKFRMRSTESQDTQWSL